MDVFDLQAKITLDSSGFERNLNAASGIMEGFGSTIEGIFSDIGSALAAAFAVDKVSDFVKGAVSAFSEFEQLVGGVDTLFKGSSGKLKENADAAFQTAGMSANDYMDTATSFAASLIQALGGDTEKAVGYVDRAVVAMSDNANKMGTDLDTVVGTYQSLARGNYGMLDNLKLGYGGVKSELERLIADASTYTDVQREMGVTVDASSMSFDNIVNAIAVVQGHLGIAGATAEEAATTIEGSVNSMKAAWENWLVGLGDENADLSGLTDNLTGTIKTVAENVTPVLDQIRESLVLVFSDLTGIDLTPALAAFDQLKTSLTEIGKGFIEGGVSGGFEALTAQIEQLTGFDLSGIVDTFAGIGEAFAGIKTAFEEGGVTGGFEAIVGQIESLTGFDLTGAVEGLSGISGIFSEIKAAFADGGIGGVFDDLVSGFESLTGIDLSAIGESFSEISEVFSGIGEVFSGDGLSGALDGLVASFESLTGIDLSGLKDGIGEFLSEVITVDDSTLTSIGGAIQSISDAFSGVDLSGAISGAATAIGDFFAAFDDVSETAVSFVSEIVAQLARDFEDMAPGVAGVAAGIGIFAGGLAAMQAFSGIPALITTISTAFSTLNTVMAANPILLVVSILGALATALITAYNTSEDFRNSVDQAWASIKEGASTAVENLKTTLGDIGGAISEAAGAIKEKVSEFIQAGRDLIQGLIDGISEKISSIGTAVKNAAGKVVDWFDEKFDRHSPSKVFAEMGRDLMRGLEVGINGEAPNVQRTIDGLRFKAPTIQTGRIDAKDSMMGKTSAASINNAIALASGSGGNGQPVVINLVMDSRTMAQVLFDPLSGVAKQKGTPIGTW